MVHVSLHYIQITNILLAVQKFILCILVPVIFHLFQERDMHKYIYLFLIPLVIHWGWYMVIFMQYAWYILFPVLHVFCFLFYILTSFNQLHVYMQHSCTFFLFGVCFLCLLFFSLQGLPDKNLVYGKQHKCTRMLHVHM